MSEFRGTSSLDNIQKDKCPFFFEISDVKRDRDGHKELEVYRRCNVPIDHMLDDGMGESCDFYNNYRKCPVYQKESTKINKSKWLGGVNEEDDYFTNNINVISYWLLCKETEIILTKFW